MALDLENQGARALVNSTAQGYGTLPNPQLYADAPSGSLNDIANLASMGDPIFGNVIPIMPQNSNPVSRVDPTDKSFMDELSRHGKASNYLLLDYHGDQGNADSMPQVLDGSTVVYHSKAMNDNTVAQAWQHQLQDYGYLDHSHPADGNWDAATTQAYQKFLFNRYLPQAVYSTDANKKASAAYLLSQLAPQLGMTGDGGAFDASAIDGKDDKIKGEVFRGYMSTTPVGGDPRHWVSKYSDEYGDGALPGGVANLKEPGFFGKVITLDGLVDPWKFIHAGRDRTVHDDQMDVLRRQLSPEDLKSLQPQLQALDSGKGFLSDLMDAEGRFSNRAKLATLYTIGAGLPFGGYHRSPWDALDSALSGASQHQDDVVAGLVGEQWEKDHAFFSGLANTTSSFLDISLAAGPVARATSLTLGAEADAVRGAALAGDGDRVQHLLSRNAQNYFMRSFNPTRWQAKFVRETSIAIAMNPEHNAIDLAHYLDTPEVQAGTAEAGLDKVKELFFEEDPETGDYTTRKQMSYDEAKQALADLWGVKSLEDTHYLAMVSNIGTAYNHQAHLRALGKTNLDAAGGASTMRKLLYVGSLRVRPSLMSFDDAHSVVDEAHTMSEWGNLVGMKKDEINGYINTFVNHPERRVMTAQAFYQDAVRRLNPAQTKRFQEAKTRAKGDVTWNALSRHYEQLESQGTEVRYASDPKTGEEMSTVQRKPAAIPPEVESHLSSILDAANSSYVQAITDWYTKKYGRKPSRAAMKTAQDEFDADPKNVQFVQEIREQLRSFDEQRQGAQYPFGMTESRPLYPEQLASVFLRPGNTFHLVQALYPSLSRLEHLEKQAFLAEWNGAWKALAISRPSTAIRAMLGDDVIRYSIELAMMGAPVPAVNALVHTLYNRTGTRGAKEFVQTVLGGSGAGFRQVERARKLRAVVKQRKQFLERAKAGAKQFEERLAEATKAGDPGQIALAKAELEDANKTLELAKASSEVSDEEQLKMLGIQDLWQAIGESGWMTDLMRHDRNGFINFAPGDHGHREAVEQAYRKLRNSAPVRVWAEAKTTGAGTKKQRVDALVKWIQGAEEAKELARSRAIEWRDYHVTQARTLQDSLEKIDKVLGYGGPVEKGDSSAYKSLPHVVRKTGTPRDAVVSQIKAYERHSKGRKWAQHWANQVDEHLTKMTAYPPSVRWFLGDPMRQEELDQWFRSPDIRHTLPIVQARRPSVFASTASQRAVQRVTRPILDDIFSPMIQGSRAYGAERMRQWWYEWAKHNFGAHWDTDRIESFAIGKARQWMLNNTYQGTRTITDMALRNFFPFVGATLSMDKFFINQVRAHPWMGGLLLKGGVKAEEAANQKSNNLDLGSWLFGGNDHLMVNPAYPFFYGAEGVGSAVPGSGPLLTLFTDGLRQDAGINSFISQIPGYSTAYAPTLLPGVGGFAANLGSDITELAFGHALGLGPLAPAGRTQEDYQKAYDKKERELAAEHGGKIPNDAEIRGAVAKDMLTKDVGGFLLPIQAHGVDVEADAIKKARDAWDKAPDVASKIKVLKSNPGHPALLLLMTDHNTPHADLLEADPGLKEAYDKVYSAMASAMPAGQHPAGEQVWSAMMDEIQAQSPWMQPYLTSIYEGKGNKPGSLAEFLDEQSSGNLHVQGPGEYTQSLEDNYQRSMGYQAYRARYVPLEKQIKDNLDQLQLSGVSTSDPQYVQLREQGSLALGALKEQLKEQFPSWYESYQKLGGDRSIGGEEIASAPIRSLTAWAVMDNPTVGHNPLTEPMKQVKQFVDQTAAQLLLVKQAGGTSADTQQALNAFRDELEKLVEDNPDLAEVIDLYHFGRWQDFVQVEEAQLAAGQAL